MWTFALETGCLTDLQLTKRKMLATRHLPAPLSSALRLQPCVSIPRSSCLYDKHLAVQAFSKDILLISVQHQLFFDLEIHFRKLYSGKNMEKLNKIAPPLQTVSFPLPFCFCQHSHFMIRNVFIISCHLKEIRVRSMREKEYTCGTYSVLLELSYLWIFSLGRSQKK